MVKRKVCISSIAIVIGIEFIAVSVLLFVFGNDLIQSNVKKVYRTLLFLDFI